MLERVALRFLLARQARVSRTASAAAAGITLAPTAVAGGGVPVGTITVVSADVVGWVLAALQLTLHAAGWRFQLPLHILAGSCCCCGNPLSLPWPHGLGKLALASLVLLS